MLRARVDEEFKISQRLDSKTRQAFALVAGFFAVIQTVAFGSFASDGISESERVVLLFSAVVAGALVAWVAHRAAHSEELKDESDVLPSAIVKWANAAGDNPEFVRLKLVSGLAYTAEARASNNASRATKYDNVLDAARVALIASGVELILAVVVRL